MPTTPADRFVFSKMARWFDWRSALLIIKPANLIGWHRNAFRLFWRSKSRPVGRPPVTAEVRDLIPYGPETRVRRRSGCRSIVVVQHATEPFAAANGSCGLQI